MHITWHRWNNDIYIYDIYVDIIIYNVSVDNIRVIDIALIMKPAHETLIGSS